MCPNCNDCAACGARNGADIDDLEAELASLRAECERLRVDAERVLSFETRNDLKLEELEYADMSWTHDHVIDAMRAERDRLRSENERLTKVYEAACAWANEQKSRWSVSRVEVREWESRLVDAIDTARERSEGSGGEGE